MITSHFIVGDHNVNAQINMPHTVKSLSFPSSGQCFSKGLFFPSSGQRFKKLIFPDQWSVLLKKLIFHYQWTVGYQFYQHGCLHFPKILSYLSLRNPYLSRGGSSRITEDYTPMGVTTHYYLMVQITTVLGAAGAPAVIPVEVTSPGLGCVLEATVTRVNLAVLELVLKQKLVPTPTKVVIQIYTKTQVS